MKWTLTKDLPPPKGENIVIGWYDANHIRHFNGYLLQHDPMTFYHEPPDYWAPIESLELPAKIKGDHFD